MAISKGDLALQYIKKLFATSIFDAALLSKESGEKISPITLTNMAKKGILTRFDTHPVTYQLNLECKDSIKSSQTVIKSSNNDNLHKALKNKNDEFYTYYADIEQECVLYSHFYQNKIIYLPADDENSNFLRFFIDNYHNFGLKQIIATSYNENGLGKKINYSGTEVEITCLQGNGDFRSEECITLLAASDIVITNPPFSLFRELVVLINQFNKKFLLVGNENTFASTEIFPLFKDRLISTGHHKIKEFFQPDGSVKKFGNIGWFTNLPTKKDNNFLPLTAEYIPENYPKYDNYDAINVDKLTLIPKNYYGVMGVPISFLTKYNPQQFILLGLAAGNSKKHKLHYTVAYNQSPLDRGGCGVVNGQRKYSRVFIQRKE